MNRRSLLRTGAALALAAPFARLLAGERALLDEILPVTDAATGLDLVKLPRGFSYRSLSWTGDAMAGAAGTPARHDGMAAIGAPDGGVTLLRNHEETITSHFGGEGVPTYDDFAIPPGGKDLPDGFPGFGGGVTGVFNAEGNAPVTRPLLAGTATNCAGGPTPWEAGSPARKPCCARAAPAPGTTVTSSRYRRQASPAPGQSSTWACSATKPRPWIRTPASFISPRTTTSVRLLPVPAERHRATPWRTRSGRPP